MGFHSHGWRVDPDRSDSTSSLSDWELLKKMRLFLVGSEKNLIIGLILVILGSGIMLLGPLILAVAIDVYLVAGDLQGLLLMAIIYGILYLINYLVEASRSYLITREGARIVFRIRQSMFSHIQDLSMDYYDKNETGRLISKVTNDVETLSEFVSSGLVDVAASSLQLIFITMILFWLNVQLALASMVILPIIVVSSLFFRKYGREAYQRTRRTIARLTGSFQENISGVRVSQSFTREEENSFLFNSINEENYRAYQRSAFIFSLLFPTIDIINALGVIIVLWYGGFLAVEGTVTIGIIVAFLAYLTRFFEPIMTLSMFYNSVQAAFASSERIVELLDTPSSILESKKPIMTSTIRGKVAFNNINFHYELDNPVLTQFNLTINENENIAIVGPTGAGKTTIINLLTRFYEFQEGTITLDDKYEIRDLDLPSFRSQLGIVLQDPFLFSGTIKENIRYGNPNASDKDIQEAAKLLGIHAFISKLPNGYETEVGEIGVRLSQGQRQLISFARTVITDPRILILDEATSSVDVQTEILIQKALKSLFRGRTSIVIAHRLSTVRDADRIIVMDSGRIVEEGNFDELLNAGNLFTELYRKQFLEETHPKLDN